MKKWFNDEKLVEEVKALRIKGFKIDRITEYIRKRGHTCYTPNLCNWFNAKRITPLTKSSIFNLTEPEDFRVLRKNKEILARELKELGKMLKKSTTPTEKSKLLKDYLTLLNSYKSLVKITDDLTELKSEAEKNLNQFYNIINEAEEQFEGLGKFIQDKIIGGGGET